MAIEKSDAILLRKMDFRETSFIVTFFTRDFGKVGGILKGARGSRARSGINPLFFCLEQIVFYEKKKSGLCIISQCEAQRIFLNILKDWDRASIAYYILELVDRLTEPGGGAEEIFDVILNSMIALDGEKDPGVVARFFEVKFLTTLGFWPGSDGLRLTKGALATLAYFERDDWQVVSKIKLTRDVGNEIKKITGEIIGDNLDKPLKTSKVFK